MIKKFYRRSQAFHSFPGHSFFSICSVFVCLYSKNNKTKHKESHFIYFFFFFFLKMEFKKIRI